ncbi:MAG TPA: hypothetical protein DF715_07540 [Oceanicaulis sp.]|nr:hypothetical protein [Oceanicaulis sp.]
MRHNKKANYISHNVYYATARCKRKVVILHLCRIEILHASLLPRGHLEEALTMLDVFDVSRKELQRAEILDDVKAGRLSLKESPQSAGYTQAFGCILRE